MEARPEDSEKVHLVEEQEEEILKHTRAINIIIVKEKDSQPNGDYPHMFIYSNLNDTLVPYTEPLYYQSLKKEVGVFREGKKDLLLHIEDKFEHMQGSSEKDKTRQYALIFAFLDKYVS